jgi:hypothetical protein
MSGAVLKRWLATAVAAPVLGAACWAAFPAVSARATSRRPSRMLVYAQEWSLYPSRTSLPAGRLVVQLWNRGQDPHDLSIRRLGRSGRMVGRPQRVGVTGSGVLKQATWRLGSGRYELYCSMPGHLKKGMHARIVVR